MVVDHVEQHLDAALVGLFDQGLEVGLAAETRVQAFEVVDPVAVEALVPEFRQARRLRHLAAGLLQLYRVDPQRGDAQVLELVELLRQALQVAAVPAAGVAQIDARVVAGITIGEAIDEHEVQHFVAPGVELRRLPACCARDRQASQASAKLPQETVAQSRKAGKR